MLLLIRGHIRGAFDTDDLYNFAKQLYDLYAVEIYIQTWTVFSNGVSWQTIPTNLNVVDEGVLKAYFRDVPIKGMLILDDSKITHTGVTEGKLMASWIPVVGWKNMWYGKAALAKYVYDRYPHQTPIINTRFDLFCNSNKADPVNALSFIQANHAVSPKTNIFMVNGPVHGVDNIYFGTVGTNHILSRHFHEHFDTIAATYKHVGNPEKVVFFENGRIFKVPSTV